jgi:hypothetical protein
MVSEHRGPVVQQSQLRNRINAILNRNLVECPYTDAFGRTGLQRLSQAPLPAVERREVDRLLRMLAALELEIEGLELELAQARLADSGLRHLVSVPGIGFDHRGGAARRHWRRQALRMPQPIGRLSRPRSPRASNRAIGQPIQGTSVDRARRMPADW